MRFFLLIGGVPWLAEQQLQLTDFLLIGGVPWLTEQQLQITDFLLIGGVPWLAEQQLQITDNRLPVNRRCALIDNNNYR
jgi:hypothetical protein